MSLAMTRRFKQAAKRAAGAVALGLTMCYALELLAAEPAKPPTRVTEFIGTTTKNGWTCYGGSFWPNAMARSPREEAVWMGSPVGLIRYDLKTGELRRWTTLDGLADNTVYDLEIDAEENVWAATMSGVSKFDGERFTGWDRKAIGHNTFGGTSHFTPKTFVRNHEPQ